MRGGAMAKSTFVTAPSFASSSSVTSINHVPRVPVPSRNTPDSGLHTRPVLSQPTLFSADPSHFPSISFSPFFYPLLHSPPASARARAHIIPEVHSSDKNEISRATLSDLLYLRSVSSAASIISRTAWRYFENVRYVKR